MGQHDSESLQGGTFLVSVLGLPLVFVTMCASLTSCTEQRKSEKERQFDNQALLSQINHLDIKLGHVRDAVESRKPANEPLEIPLDEDKSVEKSTVPKHYQLSEKQEQLILDYVAKQDLRTRFFFSDVGLTQQPGAVDVDTWRLYVKACRLVTEPSASHRNRRLALACLVSIEYQYNAKPREVYPFGKLLRQVIAEACGRTGDEEWCDVDLQIQAAHEFNWRAELSNKLPAKVVGKWTVTD